jgi:hypothetical protein
MRLSKFLGVILIMLALITQTGCNLPIEGIEPSPTRILSPETSPTISPTITQPSTPTATSTPTEIPTPSEPGEWGRLANPGFHNEVIKTSLFFPGQARDGSLLYGCNPSENLGLFTVWPMDDRHLNWSMSPVNREYVLNMMVEAGLNVVTMSSWGESFLRCGTGWSLIAPMQSAPGAHDELFTAALDQHLVIIPFIESRNDWALRDEFPYDANGEVAPGAVSQIVNLIERYLLNPEHPEWAGQWAQIFDQTGEARYAISLIHASSNRLGRWDHQGYAEGFDLIFGEVFRQTNIKVGFLIDPLPPNSNAPGAFKPIPESTGPALLLSQSILGIQSFIPEIWHPGNPTQTQLIAYKHDYSRRWMETGIPFLMDVSPGYDASIVFPSSIVYGFDEVWQEALTEMVIEYGQDGIMFNSWNGYTEGMAAVPTNQYGDTYYTWLQQLCAMAGVE